MKLAKPDSWENVRVVTSVKTAPLTYEELDIPSCYYADGDINRERESIAHELVLADDELSLGNIKRARMILNRMIRVLLGARE